MSIARRTLDLIEFDPLDLPVDVGEMRDCAARMIRTALQSLLDADAQVAESVLAMDDEIDRMNRIAHEELTKFILNNANLSAQALQAIIISRNLERIADHATNIAMDVIFWVRGADVRHQLNAAVD
jgi:phosphate transport system protein